ncbi:MAG: exodeoxyribonuclease VII large subunit, partial [Muribaculaceae bacterium]|nr:exodeoxyribonuclease VII large subunit [Muribaculaceae bacterium]
MAQDTAPISLLEYTRNIKNVLAADPGVHGVWVVAEVSDVNRHPSGHCYMELLQKDERGATVAKMRATIWKFVLPRIENKFHAATSRRFDNGMKLMLRLEANMHEVYSISANVLDIDPSYTMGDMERLRREILARLQK